LFGTVQQTTTSLTNGCKAGKQQAWPMVAKLANNKPDQWLQSW
jgi:hypothetical protein